MTKPKVFLSPSTKEYQISPITNISEAKRMREFAKEVERNLVDLGIDVILSNLDAPPSQSVTDSNDSKADLHLVLSSLRVTSPSDRGIKIYFSSSDGKSRDYATVIAENLKKIYPLPDLVSIVPNGSFVELLNTASPAVVVAIGNQSNADDVKWFDENSGDIAQNIAFSVGEVLGIENETTPLTAIGIVNGQQGYTEVRKTPSPTSKIITRIQNGLPVRIIGKLGNWYAIIAANVEGYVPTDDITAETPEQ